MKIKICLFLALLSVCVWAEGYNVLLPDPFPIYTNGSAVINHPYPGYVQKMLPTNNEYKKKPGCYIVCYSHDAKKSVYSVGHNIYVQGQIRVPGNYINRICIPQNFAGKDISAAQYFKNLCNEKIKTCKDCWAGGDSGGWFGIQ